MAGSEFKKRLTECVEAYIKKECEYCYDAQKDEYHVFTGFITTFAENRKADF